jgi:ElaB/YqjD/DUF883 family membrane-anchored ribosome-binding protein
MSSERDPETIQDDIEQTREALGDTAAALGYKSDVKARAGDRVSETKERITGAAEDAAAKAHDAMPSSARDGAQKARDLVRRQPIAAAAVAAFVVGVVVGRRRR